MNNPNPHAQVSSTHGMQGPVTDEGPFKVLVCWETIPETMTLYLIEVTGLEYDLISKAHRKYIGGRDDEPLGLHLLNYGFLNVTGAALEHAYTATAEDQIAQEWLGRFKGCAVSPGPIQCDYWLQCGIMM